MHSSLFFHLWFCCLFFISLVFLCVCKLRAGAGARARHSFAIVLSRSRCENFNFTPFCIEQTTSVAACTMLMFTKANWRRHTLLIRRSAAPTRTPRIGSFWIHLCLRTRCILWLTPFCWHSISISYSELKCLKVHSLHMFTRLVESNWLLEWGCLDMTVYARLLGFSRSGHISRFDSKFFIFLLPFLLSEYVWFAGRLIAGTQSGMETCWKGKKVRKNSRTNIEPIVNNWFSICWSLSLLWQSIRRF